MIKGINFIIILMLIVSYQTSCQSDNKNKNNHKDNLSDRKEDASTIISKSLNIDNLKQSLQNNQIRIEISFSLIDSGKIINLKDEMGHWSGQFYQYRFDLNDKETPERVLISQRKFDGNPKSGWAKFISRIEKLGIYSLNDRDRTKNYGLCNDGGTLVVEIVKENKYSEYIYPCWDVIEDQSDILKIKSILRLIQDEFGFNVFPLDLELVE